MHRRSSELLKHLPPSTGARAKSAFTLLELLVVIVIIGILATIGLPAIKGMTKSNSIIAANRQLLDDLAYARQRAISDHTKVYMVFIPPTITGFKDKYAEGGDKFLLNQYSILYGGQYTTYALLSLRSVGEQPGRFSPHYLTAWRSLPNGIFIATNKFVSSLYFTNPITFYTNAFATNLFPFPVVETNSGPTTAPITHRILPYIAFDYDGKLVSQIDEAIPLSRGSIFYARDANGNLINGNADVLETPPGNSITTSNVIHIDWLTGRARVERQEVQ